MNISSWTQYIRLNGYLGVISGAKYVGKQPGIPTPGGNALAQAEKARQAAMRSEMKKDGIHPKAAKQLADGKLTFRVPDRDTFQTSVPQSRAVETAESPVQGAQRIQRAQTPQQIYERLSQSVSTSEGTVCMGYMALRPMPEKSEN